MTAKTDLGMQLTELKREVASETVVLFASSSATASLGNGIDLLAWHLTGLTGSRNLCTFRSKYLRSRCLRATLQSYSDSPQNFHK